jgi:hypothetical protein
MFLELGGCHGLKMSSTAGLVAMPEEIAITKAILKNPVQFKGWGYAPGEYIAVNLMIPNGMSVKRVPVGQDSVRIAYAICDAYGNFKATMGARDTLEWFFQVDWDNNSKPLFKEAKPLPPGKYEILAIGQDSKLFGVTFLTVLRPSAEK